MHQLMLLERYSPANSLFWPNLIKRKMIPGLSVEQILNKYQGFEGELISFFCVKQNDNDHKKKLEEYKEFEKVLNCLILHIISHPNKLPDFLEKQVVRVGYDIGVCEEGKTIYSSIFNEILFGFSEGLARYQSLLNENFLFPSRDVAEKYVTTHNEMSAQGEDVEDYEEMVIYEIWKPRD